jgi:polyhydroxyalkanoate synthesis regulator phasin
MNEEKSLLEKILGQGEERLEAFLQDLLTNPKVVEVMGKVIQRTQEARVRIEERLRSIYQLANLPTQEDLKNLEKKVQELEEKVKTISAQKGGKKTPSTKKGEGKKAKKR